MQTDAQDSNKFSDIRHITIRTQQTQNTEEIEQEPNELNQN